MIASPFAPIAPQGPPAPLAARIAAMQTFAAATLSLAVWLDAPTRCALHTHTLTTTMTKEPANEPAVMSCVDPAIRGMAWSIITEIKTITASRTNRRKLLDWSSGDMLLTGIGNREGGAMSRGGNAGRSGGNAGQSEDPNVFGNCRTQRGLGDMIYIRYIHKASSLMSKGELCSSSQFWKS